MPDLETIKKENENLKKQLEQNSQGIQGLLAQVDAHKGELADARTISVQLRTNLILFQKSNNELIEKNKKLQEDINELNRKLLEKGPTTIEG